ncbi:LLM class flavin-dependent oxidoreductase [Parasphingopyxis algicola]|uniref:LLM class flavin-dependent oxidoreductase n=1 Tax=Parasphingopyxis algicola TaxID=2026624 RepID=UPI0015A37B92|nr:LLM class flavin-dependent oxidoreductase [Parasphingopyxis algicola]QLC26408.1 LLM class flavin-dependent oxidoreductase [Parasphingopyxis algicola]
MKLGFFTMPIHPLGRSVTETLKEDRELAILADKLGFEEGFFGEHVTDAAETITSSLIFVASLIHATNRIKLGSGTVNLPCYHPAHVAAQVAMVDHMAEGRFLFGISPGGLMSDAELFGNLDKNRGDMFIEAIDQILAIWSGEPPYNIEGEFWSTSTERTLIEDLGQGKILSPYQKPHPPIITTVVSPHSNSMTQAARRGWEPISGNFLLPKWVKSHWPKYKEGCADIGATPDMADWRVAKSIFVADDLDTAKRYATDTSGPYHGYYRSVATKMIRSGRAALFKQDPDAPDDTVTIEGVVDDVVIWGTPDKVIDELAAFREEVGEFGTLLYAGHDWVDRDLAIRSMELMAEKVAPAF